VQLSLQEKDILSSTYFVVLDVDHAALQALKSAGCTEVVLAINYQPKVGLVHGFPAQRAIQ
jgi:hypothetical protein